LPPCWRQKSDAIGRYSLGHQVLEPVNQESGLARAWRTEHDKGRGGRSGHQLFCCPEVCAHPSRLIPTYDSRRLGRVEIRIGIANSSREIVFDTTKNAEEVEKSISSSVADGDDAVMRLEDDKGHIYLVPVRTLAYVEILKEPARKVGFAP